MFTSSRWILSVAILAIVVAAGCDSSTAPTPPRQPAVRAARDSALTDTTHRSGYTIPNGD